MKCLNKILFLIGLFAFPLIANSQEKNTSDSLKGLLLNASHDSVRIALFVELGSRRSEEDSSIKFAYADSALFLAKQYDKLKYKAIATKNKGELLRSYSKKLEAIPFFEEAYTLFDSIGNQPELADIDFQLGVMNFYLNNYQKSLEYHQKSLNLRYELKDSTEIIESELGVASMYWRMGNLKSAEKHYLNALDVCEKTNDIKSSCATLNSLGAIYWGYGDYNIALGYYERALKEALKIGFKKKYVLIVNNIGLIYKERGDNNKALENYHDGLRVAKEENYPNGLAYSFSNIGEILLLTNEFEKALAYFDSALVNYKEASRQNGVAFSYRHVGDAYMGMENYPMAIKYYNLSVKTATEIDSKQHIALALSELANAYCQIRNFGLARENAKRSLDISLTQNYKDISKDNYYLLSQLDETSGSFSEALSFYKKASALKDSIFNEKSSKHIAEMQARYETEKKERENLMLRKEEQIKDLQLKANSAKIRVQYLVIIAFAVFLLIVIILAFLLNNSRKKLIDSKGLLIKRNSEINKQKEELSAQKEYLKEMNSLLHSKTVDLESKKEELQEKVNEIKEATGFKNKIFSIIGHDLRGPIGTISSIISLAMEDQLTDEKRQFLLSSTKDSAVAAYSLLENLLIWANSEQGKIIYSPKKFRLAGMVQDNIKILQEKATEKSIELIEEIDDSMEVYADSNTVDTIVRNLLSNALKFTNKGGKIIVTAKRNNQVIEISVVDNGVGISSENLQKIMNTDSLYTNDGTLGEKGSGLGLLLCFEFIKMNLGKYQINSQEGKGTSFTFSLPVEPMV